MGMKWNTIFKHKEFTVSYEETMVNVEEYWKLLEPPKKPKKHQTTLELKGCVVFVINQGIWKNIVIETQKIQTTN
jgi:hypothetical protein